MFGRGRGEQPAPPPPIAGSTTAIMRDLYIFFLYLKLDLHVYNEIQYTTEK